LLATIDIDLFVGRTFVYLIIRIVSISYQCPVFLSYLQILILHIINFLWLWSYQMRH